MACKLLLLLIYGAPPPVDRCFGLPLNLFLFSQTLISNAHVGGGCLHCVLPGPRDRACVCPSPGSRRWHRAGGGYLRGRAPAAPRHVVLREYSPRRCGLHRRAGTCAAARVARTDESPARADAASATDHWQWRSRRSAPGAAPASRRGCCAHAVAVVAAAASCGRRPGQGGCSAIFRVLLARDAVVLRNCRCGVLRVSSVLRAAGRLFAGSAGGARDAVCSAAVAWPRCEGIAGTRACAGSSARSPCHAHSHSSLHRCTLVARDWQASSRWCTGTGTSTGTSTGTGTGTGTSTGTGTGTGTRMFAPCAPCADCRPCAHCFRC